MGHKSPLVTIARGAADVARKPDRITLLKRGGSWRETVDRCRSRPRNYQPSLFVIGFVRIFLREEEFHPLKRREREISSIGGQQCHIVRSVRVRIASGRQLSMQREWWSLHPSKEGGNKGWRSWNTSSGINGNRRSNRVFFQLMARMIGDETRVAQGWGRRTRVFGRVCGRSW